MECNEHHCPLIPLEDEGTVCPAEWILKRFLGCVVRDIVPGEQPVLIMNTGDELTTSVNLQRERLIVDRFGGDWDRMLDRITGLHVVGADFNPGKIGYPPCMRVILDHPHQQSGCIALITMDICEKMIVDEYLDRTIPD
jgi:hypothetical protein